jgi:hypothetical protein
LAGNGQFSGQLEITDDWGECYDKNGNDKDGRPAACDAAPTGANRGETLCDLAIYAKPPVYGTNADRQKRDTTGFVSQTADNNNDMPAKIVQKAQADQASFCHFGIFMRRGYSKNGVHGKPANRVPMFTFTYLSHTQFEAGTDGAAHVPVQFTITFRDDDAYASAGAIAQMTLLKVTARGTSGRSATESSTDLGNNVNSIQSGSETGTGVPGYDKADIANDGRDNEGYVADFNPETYSRDSATETGVTCQIKFVSGPTGQDYLYPTGLTDHTLDAKCAQEAKTASGSLGSAIKARQV